MGAPQDGQFIVASRIPGRTLPYQRSACRTRCRTSIQQQAPQPLVFNISLLVRGQLAFQLDKFSFQRFVFATKLFQPDVISEELFESGKYSAE